MADERALAIKQSGGTPFGGVGDADTLIIGAGVKPASGDLELDGEGYSTLSLDFGGTDEYVNVGNIADLSFERTDAFSFSFWFKTSQATTGCFLSKQAVTTQRGYMIYMSSATAGRIRCFLCNTFGTSNYIMVVTNSAYNDGAWHHCVITYDGSSAASGVTIYIDGSAVATTTDQDSLSATMVNTDSFQIGDRTTASIPYVGKIDELAAYDDELTSGEVTSLYNFGSPNDVSALSSYADNLHWWRMGEGATAPTIPDDGVGSDDGTMTNMEAGDINPDVPGGGNVVIAGNLEVGPGSLGFYGTAAIAQPDITGAKGGNAALTSLLTELENLGLITDSTT